MGETKEIQLHKGIKLTRIVTAAMAGLFFFILLAQTFFFPNIQINFSTGTDAQQLASISIKKGTDVELPTPLKPGSCFLGWALSPNSTELISNSKKLSKNTTLYAVWDGAEKYAVLSVNGIKLKEVDIFDTRIDGLTASELNANWRVLDDYSQDNPNRIKYTISSTNQVFIDPKNNFSRFLGWQYLNTYGRYNELRFKANESGLGGEWSLLERDADGNETISQITDEHKFYPPNYRTTFTALLEYRPLTIQFFDKNASRHYNSLRVKLGEEVTLPAYRNDNSTVPFSHWEVQVGDLRTECVDATQDADLVSILDQIKTRYQPGEVLEAINPLYYYLGSNLTSVDGVSKELSVILKVRAVYWDDTDVFHYSVQPYTDLISGTEYHDFAEVGYNDLSLENPVAFEDDCLWFYDHDQILSYTFYDHKGVFHEIRTADLQDNASGLIIGSEVSFFGQTVYFNYDWAINIAVNYQSSAENITVKFNYGNDIYTLPNYKYNENSVVVNYTRKIGNSFVFLTGENYMKNDYIFTGWKLVGDKSERLYCAGETFTIPNLDTSKESVVLEFEAVWYLQRLLFNFNFDGGSWENEFGPDFTLMKGAFGKSVQVVKETPVRFGYDFVGWTLDTPTFTHDNELIKPGDKIQVGAKAQTLYAQWNPRRLRVLFFTKEINDQWLQASLMTNDLRGERLRSGGEIQLPYFKGSSWSTFHGWRIGDDVIPGNTAMQLTTDVLSQLETKNTKDSQGAILEVRIYAEETKNVVNADYILDVIINDSETVAVPVDHSKLQEELIQGQYFYDFYPFSLAKTNGNYSELDSNGRQFMGWSYTVNNKDYISIDETTIVPVGIKNIIVSGHFSVAKSITFQYHDFYGKRIYTDQDSRSYNYGAIITLLNKNDVITKNLIPSNLDRYGAFVGWALEKDHEAGNPDLIYVADIEQPRLQLANKSDTSTAPYQIHLDRYAEKLKAHNYVIKLYAVYSANFVLIQYNSLKDNGQTYTELKLPVYSNGNYTQTSSGGKTVGFGSPDFLDYGLAVLDESTVDVYSFENFVGWKANLPSGVSPAVKEDFQNKIWFPGEVLPVIDYNIVFEPIFCNHSTKENYVHEITVGTSKYRVVSLKEIKGKVNLNESVDVLALPRGSYTLDEGAIQINSDREVVHVVIPSDAGSDITLKPRAIQCDQIVEFYVGENVTVTGSPVTGANFQAYRVRKGYRLMDQNGVPTDEINASTKYDYEACVAGLLVSKDRNTLLGVPSHTNLTSDELLALLKKIEIKHIKSYALSDINSLETINLGFEIADDQSILFDAYAIFNSTANYVILPKYNGSARIVDAQVIAGALPNLIAVTFGDLATSQTGYAFVENNFVYYVDNLTQPADKTHVMYVLPSVAVRPLEYTSRNLSFEDSVSKIEPYALMGLDWKRVNSIMAENKQIDVRGLLGIPQDVPIFVSQENQYKDLYANPMVQSYKKTFVFMCNDSISNFYEQKIEFTYGQTFTVFNAQNNKYDFYFDKTWRQFVGWKIRNRDDKLFSIGQVFKVGISEEIKGDKFTVIFDASNSECWLNFPVEFYIYDGNTNKPYSPEALYDVHGTEYEINELLNYYDYLDDIYLPGVDQTFQTPDGSVYQFVGWGTSQTNPNNFESLMWNKVDLRNKILPNKTAYTELDRGNASYENYINVYRYYALYEKVTPDMDYVLLDNNTYAVNGLMKANVTSLNIPFAKYHDGYMLPISKINDYVFAGISNNAGLKEISIGGAINEIGQGAFNGVNAEQINFAHRGREIYYNNFQSSVPKLTIGKDAFAKNQTVRKIVLPAALKALEDQAFLLCTNLTTVSFETGYAPSLSYLGNFVFRDNQVMTDNEIVRLLVEDTNYKQSFSSVGDGIFMNTSIANVKTIDGQNTNRIVWRDRLLHVYYPNGYQTTFTFYEKEIAGYAFVNAGSNTDSSLKITLNFHNADTKIHANAFSNLHTSVTAINLKKDNNTSVKLENVEPNAFDDTVKHAVNVTTNNRARWIEKFQKAHNAGYFKFS